MEVKSFFSINMDQNKWKKGQTGDRDKNIPELGNFVFPVMQSALLSLFFVSVKDFFKPHSVRS